MRTIPNGPGSSPVTAEPLLSLNAGCESPATRHSRSVFGAAVDVREQDGQPGVREAASQVPSEAEVARAEWDLRCQA